jgi:FtsH-binding integral membrane protein
MSVNIENYDPSLVNANTRNRVLRNTYWLLALSMLPTVLGAWLGVQMGFSFFPNNPFIGFIAFFAIISGFFWGIARNKDSGIGVLILLGFTFFMGLMMTGLITHTLHFSNGGKLLMAAFGGTATIFGVMATIATVSKRDFSGMGKWLSMGVLVVLVAAVANIWLQMPALQLALLVMVLAIFSAYLLYDVQQVVNGGETNYILATLSIYIDIYNIFSSLLQLLGIFGGDGD